MRARLWLQAGHAAVEFEDVIERNQSSVPTAEQQCMFDAYVRHVTLFNKGGGALKPKHHILFHMVWQTAVRGNPKMFTTYRLESLNGVLAKVARSCHRACWETRLHQQFAVLQQCGSLSWAEMH